MLKIGLVQADQYIFDLKKKNKKNNSNKKPNQKQKKPKYTEA